MDPRRNRLTIALYASLGSVALLWMWLRGDAHFLETDAVLRAPRSTRILLSLAGGACLAALTIYATRVLARRAAWARELHMEFRALLGPLSGSDIILYALASALAEELFFRGALQPAVGWALAAILFGLVHIPPRASLWRWSLWAGVMGSIFGGLYALTGELVGPILAHALINGVNLRFIRDEDLSRFAPPESPPRRDLPLPPSTLPRLVVQRSRMGGR